MLLSIIVLILIIIPITSAHENDTVSLGSDLNTTPIEDEIYFDSNATHDHGEGTADDPYRELRDGRILDNTAVHLKNGEYKYSQTSTHSNISFIGENPENTIINGNGAILRVTNRLVLVNLTISNLNIINQGDLIATNTIFANSTASTLGTFGESYGGAVYCVDSYSNAYLSNCTFKNNYAKFGGAIYLNGGVLEVVNCSFINNTAYNYGGAIAGVNRNSYNPKVTLRKSTFINDSSVVDAAGAVYLKSVTLTAEELYFSSCTATFGSALTLIKTNSRLTGINAINNSASYDGGAIYQIYGDLTINDSVFSFNSAKTGGALYIDNVNSGFIKNSTFTHNRAELAGAVYLLCSQNMTLNNTYSNNTVYDEFAQNNLTLTITDQNYTLYNNIISDSSVPSRYSSVAEGYTTLAKHQEIGGNCWAFALLSTLESAILKVSGDKLDLSEENMKNIASLYSNYGWNMETNNGGYDNMGIGYLTSWLGPVLESQDLYNSISTISPVLDSLMHVQNILYLKRSSVNDINHIKKAIMDYGAVYSAIFMLAYYSSQVNEYVQCYRGNLPCDHAVSLVGWDDNFYIPGAPGCGAWIAKNSWGEDWGRNGYFYVSYYDTSCPKLGDNEGVIAFILNDTMKYDKNYQYDVAKTDYFFNTARTVWYKNIFTATDDEYLSAISTYFDKTTDYTYTVYVNNEVKQTKSARTSSGYYTFNLDEMIPLKTGDVFEIVFKITVDGDAGVPISEKVSLNNYFYYENISFISYDGKTWKDLYDLEGTYPDHIYDSQVACIKAFTVLNPIGAALSLTIDNNIVSASVVNQWGYPVSNGKVTFTIGNETMTVDVVNGVAKHVINIQSQLITAEFNAIGYDSSNASLEMHNPLLNTSITLNVTGTHNPVNITANITDENGNPVKYGYVVFMVNYDSYQVDVVDGTAKLENLIVDALDFWIIAEYHGLYYYNSSRAVDYCKISLINTRITLNVSTNAYNNPAVITANVVDEDNKPVNYGIVMFVMEDGLKTVEVSNGVASFNHTFSKTGMHKIIAFYYGYYYYNASNCNQSLNVSKIRTNLTFDMIIEDNHVVMATGIRNSIMGFTINLNLNGKQYKYTPTEGYVTMDFEDLETGQYNYTITLISSIYEAEDINGTFNITHQKTAVAAGDASIYYGGEYKVTLKDKSGNIIPYRDVYLTINGKTYKKRSDSEGVAVFNIAVNPASYLASVKFIGDDEYIKSSKSVNINVKSTVDFKSSTYTYNSNYIAVLRDMNGDLLTSKQVTLIFNGQTHQLVSNSKGEITFNVNLKQGSYSVKLTNPITGEVKSQTIKVVKRITGNSAVTMYYGAGKVYKVKVLDDNGGIAKGVKITFKINNKKYTRTTDSKGYASFKITQKPGKYTVTVEYKGFKVSNKIIIKSTLVTKNIKVKKSKTIKFIAKLLNKKGKVLKNKKITFKFKGKTYKIKTDKKGKAVLKITKKYKKGKYTITTSYGKLKNKNKIRII